MRLRILVALIDAASRVGDYLLTTFAPSKPPADAWHPSQGRPKPIEHRPFTEAELDAAREEFIGAQVRALLVDKAGWTYPPAAMVDLRACRAMWALPTHEGHDA